MNNYGGQVDWGDWQNMPDYRDGWRDKHKSGITEIGRALDVTTYIPGLNKTSDFLHDGAGRVMTTANTVLSPVVKAIHKYTVPDYNLNKNNFIGDIHRYTEEKPADALAIAAASYFTAGAAANAAGGAGAAAAPAASGGAGAAGGLSGSAAAGSAAITPAFASGAAPAAGVTSGVGAGAITPAFGAAGLSLAPAAVGSGGLGAAGTAAANSLLTPAFASWGASGAMGSGLLGSVKDLYGNIKKYDSYRSNLQKFADADKGPSDRQLYNQQAGAMADRILNSGNRQPQTARQRVANQMMKNRAGMKSWT